MYQISDLDGIHVSLPRNDARLAQRAQEIGARGVKAHILLHHRASGTEFGDLDKERSDLQAILDVGLPTGLVVGAGDRVESQTIRRASSMGFAYFDLYAAEMPANYVHDCGPTTPVVAMGPTDTPEDARRLVDSGIGALELSTLPPSDYGSPLSKRTIGIIKAFRAAVAVSLIVPSQHLLSPSDVPKLRDAGANVVLLGAVSIGNTIESLSERLPPFLRA